MWDTTIDINVLQGRLSVASVELPAGARLVEQDIVGQRVVDPDENDSEKGAPSHVEVELDRAIEQGQAGQIQLRCERQLDPRESGAKDSPDVAGFNVRGAVRQSGHVGFVFASVWRARLDAKNNVFRPREMPAGFREEGVLGSETFQFLSQPFSLQMSVVPREQRVTNSSVFVLDLSPNQASLETRLSYNVVGRHLDLCSVLIPGWRVDSASLIVGDTVEPIEFDAPSESRLDVNLPREMRGEFELRVTASQQILSGTEFVALNMPVVEDEQTTPPVLVVIADDRLDVRWDMDRSTGLRQSGDADSLRLPEREYPPQVFTVTSQDASSFAAELQMRPGHISVASNATAEIDRKSLSVVQNLAYEIRYEPVSSLALDAPSWLMQRPSATILLDGEPVRDSVAQEPSQDGRVHLTLPLEEPRLGNIDVVVGYGIELSELPVNEPTASIISLARPLGANHVAPFSIVFRQEPHIEVACEQAGFKAEPSSMTSENEGLRFVADLIPPNCDLMLTYKNHAARRTTIVERVWLQTWLTATSRQDRAVLRILSNEESIELQLPRAALENQLALVVDGAPVSASPGRDGMIVLAISAMEEPSQSQGGLRLHIVELGWRREYEPAVFKRTSLDVPHVRDTWVQHIRWHLIAPRDQMVLAAPQGMAGDLVANLAWWRKPPQISQREFEMWAGASMQPSLEAIGQAGAFRQYSFAALDLPPGVHVTTVGAGFAMLAASALALVGGIAFVFVRQLRHPSVVVAVSLFLIGLAFVWPAIALFGGQCAALVIIILVVARVLRIPFLRRKRSGSLIRHGGQPSAAGGWNSSRIRTDAPLSVSPSTTANAGSALPLGTTDLK